MYLVAAARVALSGDLYLAVTQLGSVPARGAGSEVQTLSARHTMLYSYSPAFRGSGYGRSR